MSRSSYKPIGPWSFEPPPTFGERLSQLGGLIQDAIAWFIDLRYIGTAISMGASVLYIWYAWGWDFLTSLGLIVLILVHEMGHSFVLMYYGIGATAPLFIPGLAAFVKPDEEPIHAKQAAYIAFGGPFLGGLGAFCCYILFLYTGSSYWHILALAGAVVNLLNLLPAAPLDGSHVVPAIWRGFLWIGLAASFCLGSFTQNFSDSQANHQDARLRMVANDSGISSSRTVLGSWSLIPLSVLSAVLGLSCRAERQQEEAEPPAVSESTDLWFATHFRYQQEERLERIRLRRQKAQYFVLPTSTRLCIAALYFGLAIGLAAMICDLTIGFAAVEVAVIRWIEFNTL